MNDEDFPDGAGSTQQSSSPAIAETAPAVAYPEPQEGGSYTRNPDTGALTLVDRAGLDATEE